VTEVTGAPDEWTWDASLYAGRAAYYATGRAAYPPELADALVAEVPLDGTGLLVDVGCGPGSLTLLLAPHFTEVLGVDADADMLAAAARLAAQQGVRNVAWRHLRGEDLSPDEIGSARMVTFAQSFHWMDRPRVASVARRILGADGVLVHVHATTHQGVAGDEALPRPRPPWERISQLVERYLGTTRRAGQGVLPNGTPGDEESIYRAAGFVDPKRLEVPGRIIERSADEVAAAVYSLSSSAPHLFGDRFAQFDADLRELLAAGGGVYSEQMRPIDMDVWH
jgi:SAM-dependent methyltransferase